MAPTGHSWENVEVKNPNKKSHGKMLNPLDTISPAAILNNTNTYAGDSTMNAIEQIAKACGNYIGLTERAQTAMGCLLTVGIPESRALGVVASQLAYDIEEQDAKSAEYWKSAHDYMPNDTSRRLHERSLIVASLRAMVPAPKLHPVMADALRGFGGVVP